MKGRMRALGLGVAGLFVAAAAFHSPAAQAEASLDRKYSLERVSFLPSWDNVDNLFRQYVEEAYRDYFSVSSRFSLMGADKAKEILLDSKIEYKDLIDDPSILEQVARAVKAETVLRTKILKEGPKYQVTIDWLHAPKMDLVATVNFSIDHPAPGEPLSPEDLKAEIKKGLDQLVAKVPFFAHVTGRDRDWVTVNAGVSAHLAKGDRLTISTIEDVKVHPILHTIVDWRMARVGIVEVDEIDGGIAFCRVVEEEEGRTLSRYQKVTQIAKAPPPPPTPLSTADDASEQRQGPPRLGWVNLGLLTGGASRDVSSSGHAVEGSGLSLGAHADGQIWMNRSIFVEMGFGYGFFTDSQEDLTPTAGANAIEVNTTFSNWRAGVGYTYLLTDDFYGPKGWGKIGYQSMSYSQSASLTNLTGNSSFGGVYLGLGADLPVRDRWGALISFEIGVFSGTTLEGFTASPGEGATSVHFYLGGYYLLGSRMALRVGFDMQAQGADLESTEDIISHRVISFAPSLVFYF